MDERIVIRHLNLGKANQAGEFPIRQYREITAGRDSKCEIKFDPDRDDLVSRKHAKITVDKADPLEFSITDLGSRNGTFVNKQRIFSPVKLMPGDVVQFGAGGPEFQFDVDPWPAHLVRPTRLATGGAAAVATSSMMPPTREAALTPSATAVAPAPAPIGKATVERMITQTKTQTRNNMLIGGGILLLLLLGIAGFVYMRKPVNTTITRNVELPHGPTATQIAAGAMDSVVYFEIGWKLFDTESGRQLSHVYLPNVMKGKDGKLQRRFDIPMAYMPVFLAMSDSNYEPILSTEDGDGKYQPIGERGTGSGFVVSPDGFILTNRHVAAGWYTRYDWNPRDQAGMVLGIDTDEDDNSYFAIRGAIPNSQFPAWVPANAQVVVQGPLDLANAKKVRRLTSGKAIEGRNDYMDVTFAKNRIRIPAKLARVSDHIDVAMVKIDLPRSLHKLELNDNYDTIKPGDSAIVMGYPGMAPSTVAVTASQDVFNQSVERKDIPDPTVTVGNIGRVVRSGEVSGTGEGVFSRIGDVYQVNVANTGPGNSGGPVVDDQGHVIGIFTSGGVSTAGIYYFAVPVRYGIELMGVNKVSR